MPARISEAVNAFETTLAATVNPSDGSALLTTVSGLEFPTYLALDPEIPGKREIVRVDSVIGTTVTLSERYLEGSSLPSGITHDAGSIVRAVVAAQFIEDLHDRIDSLTDHGGHTGLTDDDHTQYLTTGRHDTQSRHQPGTSIGTGVAGASAVGDSAAEGVATGFSRQDHRHSRESFGNPVASAPADTMSQGAAATVARSDHRHAREAAAVLTAIGVSVKSAAGSDPGANVEQTIAFNAENFDTDGFHDNAVNNSRLTVPGGLGGKYLVTASILLSAGSVNSERVVGVRKNGSGTLAIGFGGLLGGSHFGGASFGQSPIVLSGILALLAGDFIELRWLYNSGTGVSVVGFGSDRFEMMRLGA